jgi:hypothetical protein
MKTALAITLILYSTVGAFAQGTVHFSNNALYLISEEVLLDPQPATASLEYGLFYGIGESTSLTLLTAQFGVNSTTGAGLIASPADSRSALSLVGIPGTTPNETDVWLQMAGWSAIYGTDYVAAHNAFLAFNTSAWWGQSAIANISAGLGATLGPGAQIWTSASNTTGTLIPAFVVYVHTPEPTVLALVALSAAIVMVRTTRLRRQSETKELGIDGRFTCAEAEQGWR